MKRASLKVYITFCMMLSVYLAVLTLASPTVDPVLLRVAGFIGTIIGLLYMMPLEGWWQSVVHLPLLSISLYAFVLGVRRAVNPLPAKAEVSS
ncbi:MAG: hypothetical protein IMW89_09835 [Ktedonobacteraceae bacterium]|nr:hypothetical protein [Ktedonobacteraceae bacterium]